MLIQSAINLAKQLHLTTAHPRSEVIPAIGVIKLGPNGEYLGIDPLGKPTDKGQPTRAQIWGPRRNGRTGDPTPEFIVDKFEYVLGSGEKAVAYAGSIATAAKKTGDAGLKALYSFLVSDQVGPARKDYARLFPKIAGNLVIGYDGGYLHDRPKVLQYWLDQPLDCYPEAAVCSCCGKVKPPVRKHPKVSGGGLRASLISFNSNVTDSYGETGAHTFPVCSDCAAGYSLGIQRLLKDDYPDPITGEIMPRANLPLADKQVAIYWAEDGADHGMDLRAAFDNGVYSGLPPGDNSVFHYAVLSQLSTGRLTVEQESTTSLLDFTDNLREFYEQLRLESIPEVIKSPYTPNWYRYALIAGSEKLPPSFVSALFTCAVHPSVRFPPWLLNKALNRIAKKKEVSVALASLVKAILIRNYKDTDMKLGLNIEHPDVAYQFGCYFAMVEFVHRRAIKSNQTLSYTLLSGASTRPHTVQPRLERTLNICLNKCPELSWCMRRVNEIRQHITTEKGKSLPSLFTPRQQAEFTMGYYHQKSELWKPKAVVASETAA